MGRCARLIWLCLAHSTTRRLSRRVWCARRRRCVARGAGAPTRCCICARRACRAAGGPWRSTSWWRHWRRLRDIHGCLEDPAPRSGAPAGERKLAGGWRGSRVTALSLSVGHSRGGARRGGRHVSVRFERAQSHPRYVPHAQAMTSKRSDGWRVQKGGCGGLGRCCRCNVTLANQLPCCRCSPARRGATRQEELVAARAGA
jgi:hypothetical protein